MQQLIEVGDLDTNQSPGFVEYHITPTQDEPLRTEHIRVMFGIDGIRREYTTNDLPQEGQALLADLAASDIAARKEASLKLETIMRQLHEQTPKDENQIVNAITSAGVNLHFKGNKDAPPEIKDFTAALDYYDTKAFIYDDMPGRCASAFFAVFEQCAEAFFKNVPFSEYGPAQKAGAAFVPLFRAWRLEEALKDTNALAATDALSLPTPVPRQRKPFLPMRSTHLDQAALRFIISEDEEKRTGMSFTGGKRGGTITLSLQKEASHLSIPDLDVSKADLFVIISSTLAELKTECVSLAPEMVLDSRGIKRKGFKDRGKPYNGCHRTEDLDEVHQDFLAMQTLHGRAENVMLLDRSVPGKRGAYVPHTVESYFFIIAPISKQGARRPYAYACSLGPVAKAFDVQGQFSYISRTALKYSAVHERTEKTLAYYFWAQHSNSQGTPVKRRIRDIIEWCKIPTDPKRPQRLVDRFDAAMCQLVDDGVLGWFAYPRDGAPPLRKWLDYWLNLLVEVAPAPGNPVTLTANRTKLAAEQANGQRPKASSKKK